MKVQYKYQQKVAVRPVGGGVKTVTVKHSCEGAVPLSAEARWSNYVEQNGFRSLTTRQRRACRKAENRAHARSLRA